MDEAWFEKLQAIDDEFAKQLGLLSMVWADTEAELYQVLRHYAGVSEAVARALFGGSRARDFINSINAIAHNMKIGEERRADLKFVFAQINAINTQRDHVIHHASESLSFDWNNPERKLLTNARRARKIGEHYADIVTAGMLADMVYDLYGIVNHLNMHWATGNPKFSPWEEDPGERTTWRYKSPQPADLNYGSEKGQKKRS